MRSLSDFSAFDIHHHVGSLDIVAGSSTGRAPTLEDDIARRLKYMDTNNISAVMLMPSNGYSAADGIQATRRVNDYVAKYRDQRPDRFPAAVGTVSPLDGDGAIDEIDRCVNELGMKGIVWHHRFQGTAIDHPMMDKFLQRLQEHNLPAFIHLIADSSLESPWRLEILADRFPAVQFVALDGFSSPDHAHWMPYLAEKHPNIIFDTGVMVSVAHLIEIFVRRIGAHRLLLGTDFYSFPKLFNTAFPLNEILESDLTDDECRAILSGNARRLLSIN
ncbi:MAG: amidohydrolase 2 [Candidimonas sp.]|nr:MAG: amidohydrolase 2 [Candidimonas sp.]TAM25493.1 MAG: amidohydrolase 2 [Candidimonas sp.]